jgi:hypothetical protein
MHNERDLNSVSMTRSPVSAEKICFVFETYFYRMRHCVGIRKLQTITFISAVNVSTIFV